MTIDLKDRLYTSSEVAEILGVSLRSVYRYLDEGKLDADIKTATGRHRFSKKNILDFLQPGGITREEASNTFKNEDISDEEFDVLDLPALNRNIKSNENSENFNFDIDEDFFKSLEDFNLNENQDFQENNNEDTPTSHSKVTNGDFIDDDLERLLREFEEKEGLLDEKEDTPVEHSSENKIKKDSFSSTTQTNSTLEDDFDLDSFFKELEEEDSVSKNKQTTQLDSTSENFNNKPSEKSNKDFDFDIDFLEDFFADNPQNDESTTDIDNKTLKDSEKLSNSSTLNTKNSDQDSEESEDNWLERFRKAASQNSKIDTTPNVQEDKLKDSFFENSNLDHFFDNSSESSESSEFVSKGINSLIGNSDAPEKSKYTREPKVREIYYNSSLNGLKEIAQNIDKISRKFDTDYAFTLNAGLSLHKPISPFTLIHVYIRERDLELFEDYLNLSESTDTSSSSVCLLIPEDTSIFEDSYELHGLYVVSNVQLRSDLIDKGLDKLAREI